MSKLRTAGFGGISAIGILMASLGFTQAQAANTLTAAEQKAGFKLLFDGKSSSQWSLNWGIDDSAMHSPNTGAMIYSKEEFSNFEWKVDFKVNAGGNSGFFIRTKTDWYCDGFEVAALDSKTGGDADARSNGANGDKLPAGVFNINKGTNFTAGSDAPIKRTGSIYDIYPTTKNGVTIPNGGAYVDLMKPAMEWNSMVIWANGNNIETWLNGMKVTDFVIGSPDFMNRFHRSKFGNNNNQCGDDYAKLASGTLVVQDHGAGLDVWMRNVKIRSFTPGSKLPSPVAAPEGGTYAAATKVKLDAGVTGASIRYTLDGTTPTESSLLYNDSTGLTISGTSTLKAATFRATFLASDVISSVYTVSGTGIGWKPQAAPEIAMSREGNRLILANRNGSAYTVDLISVQGEKVRSRKIGKTRDEIPLQGLESGMYLVSMHDGAWSETRKIALP